MGTFFLNVGIVGGVALAAVPLILHLFMRQTPKHVVFPALRLIRERQKRSKKRLRVKNWLLLLARMALLALMALALARPRLFSKTSLGSGEVPTAMALVFDTSLSMEYRERDRSRLEEAKERALGMLERMEESSRVFVIDSSDPIAPPALSPSAARKRLGGLTTRALNRPLNSAVGRAYKAVAGMEQPRHEVYVFTDLARTAWELGQPVEGLDVAKGDKTGTSTYVIRLSPPEPRDTAIVEAGPETDFNAQGEPVAIRALIRTTGPAARRVVEFRVDGQKRDQTEVQLEANGQAEVRMTTPKLTPGPHRVEFQLMGEPDPLKDDDRHHLTLDVQAPMRVLVVADNAVDAEYVEFALDPVRFRSGGGRPFPVTRVATPEFANLRAPLRDFGCIFLLNVAELSETDWGRLNTYVREGGGLVIGLGDRVLPAAINDRGKALLPAALGELREVKDADFTFGTVDLAHPIFAHDGQSLGTELASVPIRTYRAVTPIEGARRLLAYKNDDPALLERVFPGPRTGRVLLWTTALSRRPGNTEAELRAAWNEFPIRGWSFFAVMNQTVPALAGVAGRRLNYEAGEDVTLTLEPGARYTSFSIQAPGEQTSQKLSDPIDGGTLLIQAPPRLGQWTVTASTAGSSTKTLGFSVNFPQAEAQLATLSEAELNGLFGGKEGYALADDTQGLDKVVLTGRYGWELFPYLMPLILLIVTLENLLANTFYREKGARAT